MAGSGRPSSCIILRNFFRTLILFLTECRSATVMKGVFFNMKKLLVSLLCLIMLFPAIASAGTVVTSFYPVWLIALNLTDGIDGIEVRNLAEPATGCLHDYPLQNSDMVALSQADVFLINGAGMETFLPVISGAYPDLPVVDASAGISLLELEDDGEMNPHIWLDPQRTADMASNLAEGLIRCFPDHKEQISANLASYRERLMALKQTFDDELQDTVLRKVVIMHEALPYFAEACNLPVSAIIDKEPDDDLSSARLARILDLFRSENPLPLILKSEEKDRSVDIIVMETGASVCELDPVVTGPADPPLDYYESVMLRNLHVLLTVMK